MLYNSFVNVGKIKLVHSFILCPFFVFFLIVLINTDHPVISYATTVNGPIVTKYVDDISGSDVFKVTIGLTNLHLNSGIVEVCLTSLSHNDSKICNLVDASKEYSQDFPLHNCDSCIISAGTYVFPKETIPINSEIEACVFSLNTLKSTCDKISNSPNNKVEDIVIKLE